MDVNPKTRPVIIFDDRCNFCQGSINFVRNHGGEGKFDFIGYSNSSARAMLDLFGFDQRAVDSMVLIEGEQLYVKSTAVLRACKHLTGFWKTLGFLEFVPQKLRDFVYDLVAKYRMNITGQSCEIPASINKS